MRFSDLSSIAFRALLVNKGRTTLTMLGIVIGICSVILMIAVGESAQKYLLSQVASFGSDLVFVANGRGEEMRGGPPTMEKQTLTARDYEKLKSLPWTKGVTAAVITNDLVTYGSEDKITTISGSAPDEIIVFNMQMKSGRFLDETDVAGRARVVVLGAKVTIKLFGEQDAVGQVIKVSKQSFRVIGVLSPSGSRFFNDVDNQIYIPYTAAFDLYNKNRINFIGVKVGDVPSREARNLIREKLREMHSIVNPENDLEKDDFRVGIQEDAMRNADTITTVLQILLASLASISLFVAGIGIMNIMYVTVTERTQEIGLRLALGATRNNVLNQFLTEAVLITVFAGLGGILSGIALSWIAIQIILQFQNGWSFVVPWNGATLGFGISAAIGVVFGYFPARRAARLNPIEALRYE